MDKNKNKGLADSQDGEFILNESGTSVTIDADAKYSEDRYDSDSVLEEDDIADKKGEDE
jgi:hypothetical protein